jgi:glycosyltransferase involved in cell wall biosynthesis
MPGFVGFVKVKMKEKMPKGSFPGSWMIFSYFFNIDAKASSQHLDDRIPHLEALGVKPVVLSSICSEKNREVLHYRVPSISPSGIRFELRYLKRRIKLFRFAAIPLLLAILPLYLLEKAIINLESEWSWFPLAFLRGLLLYRKIRPGLIYSTGGPPTAHLAAGLLAWWVKAPWIAELQDPILFEVSKRSKTVLKIDSKLERFIMENASAVVFLTEGAKEKTLGRTRTDASKAYLIHPGACPPQMPKSVCSRGELCRLAHFGSFGGSRNPGKFLQGLQILLDEDPGLAEQIRFDLYGTVDSFSKKLIDSFRFRGIVTCFGKVSRYKALEAMRKSDALVLIENPDRSYETIPAKVYEYFQMNRPILGLLHNNPYLKKMLVDRGHLVANGHSPAEISEQIGNILETWRKGNARCVEFPGSPHTVEDAAKKLVEIFMEIAGRDNRLPAF